MKAFGITHHTASIRRFWFSSPDSASRLCAGKRRMYGWVNKEFWLRNEQLSHALVLLPRTVISFKKLCAKRSDTYTLCYRVFLNPCNSAHVNILKLQTNKANNELATKQSKKFFFSLSSFFPWRRQNCSHGSWSFPNWVLVHFHLKRICFYTRFKI